MLTSNGLLVINQYLTNALPSWAGSIGIGTLSSSVTASTTQYMQYEFTRVPVTLKSYRTVSGSNQIVLKATLDPEAVFKAYEIGVFPMTVNLSDYTDNAQISNFSETFSGSSIWFNVATSSPAVTITSSSAETRPRISNIMVAASAGQTIYIPGSFSSSVSTTPISIATNKYNSYDYVDVLFYCASAMSGTSSITFTLGDDSITSQSYWVATGSVAQTSTGSFGSARLAFGTKPAAFTDLAISASLKYQGSGTLLFDHIKFVTGEYKTSANQLVSRTTSSDPNTPLFIKYYGQPMDIEYYIQVT